MRRKACRKLSAIKDRSPKELYEELNRIGYVNQKSAKKTLCLYAYRHIRRLKDKYLNRVPENKIPPKSNVLMLGPTGCGKSYLAELLFSKLLGVPVTTVDLSSFTECGYVGRSVCDILSQLIGAANGNAIWATMGIVIMDEFDKIAGSSSNIRYAGAGTTKDVSGFGVQRELLGMVEGGSHSISPEGQISLGSPTISIKTDDVGFIGCGAFSNIKEISMLERGGHFGFGANAKHNNTGGIAYHLDENDTDVEVFQRYGFLPELIGRFNSIVRLSPLNSEQLKTILIKNALPQFQEECRREGLTLSIPDEIIDIIVQKAIERKTGARGLIFHLNQYLEDKAFESFGQNKRQQEMKA